MFLQSGWFFGTNSKKRTLILTTFLYLPRLYISMQGFKENTNKCFHWRSPEAGKAVWHKHSINTDVMRVCECGWVTQWTAFPLSSPPKPRNLHMCECVCIQTATSYYFNLRWAGFEWNWSSFSLFSTDGYLHPSVRTGIHSPLAGVYVCIESDLPPASLAVSNKHSFHWLRIRNWISKHKIKNCCFTERIKRMTHWTRVNTFIFTTQ